MFGYAKDELSIHNQTLGFELSFADCNIYSVAVAIPTLYFAIVVATNWHISPVELISLHVYLAQ